jgi:hypothetical protein
MILAGRMTLEYKEWAAFAAKYMMPNDLGDVSAPYGFAVAGLVAHVLKPVEMIYLVTTQAPGSQRHGRRRPRRPDARARRTSRQEA